MSLLLACRVCLQFYTRNMFWVWCSLPSENHPFKSTSSSSMLNNLKFNLETITSLQPHQTSKKDFIYRKQKNTAHKTCRDSLLHVQPPFPQNIGSTVFSLLAQIHLTEILWRTSLICLDRAKLLTILYLVSFPWQYFLSVDELGQFLPSGYRPKLEQPHIEVMIVNIFFEP